MIMVILGPAVTFELCLHYFNFWEREWEREKYPVWSKYRKMSFSQVGTWIILLAIWMVHSFTCFWNFSIVVQWKEKIIKYMLFYVESQNLLNWLQWSKLFRFYLLGFIILYLIFPILPNSIKITMNGLEVELIVNQWKFLHEVIFFVL